MPVSSDGAVGASDLARQAEEVAARLKPGSWDSVQALALLSIAKSLATIAAARGQGDADR